MPQRSAAFFPRAGVRCPGTARLPAGQSAALPPGRGLSAADLCTASGASGCRTPGRGGSELGRYLYRKIDRPRLRTSTRCDYNVTRLGNRVLTQPRIPISGVITGSLTVVNRESLHVGKKSKRKCQKAKVKSDSVRLAWGSAPSNLI